MTIISTGTVPTINPEASALEFALFQNNFQLILDNEDAILQKPEYFFCQPAFSYCVWPYIPGGGMLPLGYLLKLWKNPLFAMRCNVYHTTGSVLVTSFGGSPLSGDNWCRGVCTTCKRNVKRRWPKLSDKASFVIDLRRAHPFEISASEDYGGYIFDWGGNGLKEAQKTRPVTTNVTEPVGFATLIAELSP
ncbi:hypothetical protein KBI23_28215 [bacterium]|nr:hypothetical protein [bacterium]